MPTLKPNLHVRQLDIAVSEDRLQEGRQAAALPA